MDLPPEGKVKGRSVAESGAQLLTSEQLYEETSKFLKITFTRELEILLDLPTLRQVDHLLLWTLSKMSKIVFR